ncbi:MAG: protein kinase [Candidatus Obscuribacterales bacterium]|nr:protein kinase [Candidatus Obscuribacterales bacterium]
MLSRPAGYRTVELDAEHLLDERLRIKKRLGEGGFGTVYEARDEHLNRTVAVKVLRPSLMSDSSIWKRFLREGKILAAVHSDFLVQLFSVNISTEGLLYMVMELVSGKSLRQELNNKTRLNEADTLRVAHGVAMALSTLDSHGVVHRDLKPDNIMLVPGTGDAFGVKVLDFGLSALVNKGSVNDSYKTESGTMLGSVHYIAPELCTGERASFQSDCYALGCLLYECLAGEPPFTANDPAAVVFQHVSKPPPETALLQGNPRRGLQQLIFQLLEKDATLRYPGPQELLDAIELCMNGGVPAARPHTTDGARKLPASRRKESLPAALICAIFVIGLIVANLAGHQFHRESPSPSPHNDSGKLIRKLSEKLYDYKPTTDIQFPLTQRLLKKPHSVVASEHRRLQTCVQELVGALDKDDNGLSPTTADAVLQASRKLITLEEPELSQTLLFAAINCLSRRTSSVTPEDSDAQLLKLLAYYEEGAKPDNSVLDTLAGRLAETAKQNTSKSDTTIECTLFAIYSKHKIPPPLSLREEFVQKLNAVPVSEVVANISILQTIIKTSIERREVDIARKAGLTLLRGLTETRSTLDPAIAAFALGNDFENLSKPTAAEFWKLSIKYFERAHQSSEHYIEVLTNYGSYLIGVGDFTQAETVLKKAYEAVEAGTAVSRQTLVNLLAIGIRLPEEQSNQQRSRRLLSKLICKRSGQSSTSNDSIETIQVLVEALLRVNNPEEARHIAEQTIRSMRMKGASYHSIYHLRRLYASSLARAGNPRGIEVLQELANDTEFQRLTKEQQASLYDQLSLMQKEIQGVDYCNPISSNRRRNSSTENRLPAYVESQIKALQLRGRSASWAALYARAFHLLTTGQPKEGLPLLLELANSRETKALPLETQGCYWVTIASEQSALGQHAEAISNIEKALQLSPTRTAVLYASECHFNGGNIDKGCQYARKRLDMAQVDRAWSDKFVLSERLWRMSEREKALPVLEDLAHCAQDKKTDGELPSIYLRIATVYAQRQDMDKAKSALECCTRLRKDNSNTQKVNLATLYLLAEQPSKASLTLAELIEPAAFKKLPQHEKHLALTMLASAQAKLKQPKEAHITEERAKLYQK